MLVFDAVKKTTGHETAQGMCSFINQSSELDTVALEVVIFLAGFNGIKDTSAYFDLLFHPQKGDAEVQRFIALKVKA